MDKDEARGRFAELAAGDEERINLAEAALLIAAEADARLDPRHYLHRFEALARQAGAALHTAGSPAEAVVRLNRFLYGKMGFAGNRDDYYDPRNSFLNEVLDRRLGIPITLAVVYMEVARRLGLRVEGVNFPGHFLLRHAGAGEIIVDPFVGEVLTQGECEERLRAMAGSGAVLHSHHLRPAGTREILARMLTNLNQIYFNRGEWESALACCDRILLLTPDAPAALRVRGILYDQLDCFPEALADLERYLELAPDDPAAAVARERLEAIRQRAHRMN